MNTGTIIKRIRHERGITQQQLSELTGIDSATIRKYENGQYPVTKKAAHKLANALNINPFSLIVQDINIVSSMHILFLLFYYYGGEIRLLETKDQEPSKRVFISFNALDLLLSECSDDLSNLNDNTNKKAFINLEQFPESIDLSENKTLLKCIAIFDEWLETGRVDFSSIGIEEYDPEIGVDDYLSSQLLDIMFEMRKKKDNDK